MDTMAMILAGGESPGLGILTAVRAEPAVPFGGKYRIIDFSLSNCVNSGIYNVAVLTQYQPRSLNEHIGNGKPWDLDRAHGGVRLLHPFISQRGHAGTWQEGNADAIRSNLDIVADQGMDHVLILAGDHVYKMDYGPMLHRHVEIDADVTVAVRSVSPFDTHRFGMVTLDSDGRLLTFEEKPKRTRSTIASMGIYVFKREVLIDWLNGPGRDQHHLGPQVLPSMLGRKRVYGYMFQGYWADVGNVQAYFEANMGLLAETPALDLYDPEWVIHTRSEELPAALIGADARVDGNLLCDGCQIEGTVLRSVISPGVYVAPGAVVRDSIVMNDSFIGPHAVLDRVIVDKDVVVGEGACVGDGEDNTPNQRAPQRLNTGISVVGKGTHLPAAVRVGRNVEVGPHLPEHAFASDRVPSGMTVTAS